MKLRLQITTTPGSSTTFEHAGPVIRIGREAGCELALQGEANDVVSRQHARVELKPTGATLSNLSQSNATLLNGRLIEDAPLRQGDRIQLGHTGPTLAVLEIDLSPPADAPRTAGSRSSIGLIAAGVAAAVVVLVSVVLVVRATRPAPHDNPSEVVQNGTLPQPPSPPQGTNPVRPETPDTTGKPLDPDPNGSTGPVVKPSLPEPSLEEKKVGEYVVPKNGGPSVLLQRLGEVYPWVPLLPGSPIKTGQMLVSLPGCRSPIALDSGVQLTLWGNLPEFSPPPLVLESAGMFNVPDPSSNLDLDFTLDRGRIHLANRKPSGPARVRLRFQREVWELTLPHENSQVCAELWAARPRPEAVGQPPLFQLNLTVHTGQEQVQLQTGSQTLPLSDRTSLRWRSRERVSLSPQTLSELPKWWTQGPNLDKPQVQDVMLALLDGSKALAGSSEVIDTIRSWVNNTGVPTDREVGVLFLGALEGLQPLITFLENSPHPGVRGTAAFALQAWLSRASHHGDELARLLEGRNYAREKIILILKLLQGYSAKELTEPTTYENLINYLNHQELMVRDLAYHQLWLRAPEMAGRIEYNPTWNERERQKAVAEWRKWIPRGKLPSMPTSLPGGK